MLQPILDAVKAAVKIPVTPAPQRRAAEAVVYRWYPGEDDGSLCTARLELRFTAPRLADALGNLSKVRAALLAEGDTGVVGEGPDTILLTGTAEGGGSGYARGSGLYYVKAGFRARGRSDHHAQ